MRTMPLERRAVGRRRDQNKPGPVAMLFVSWFLLIMWLSDLIYTGMSA
jgi:hypothetical protein